MLPSLNLVWAAPPSAANCVRWGKTQQADAWCACRWWLIMSETIDASCSCPVLRQRLCTVYSPGVVRSIDKKPSASTVLRNADELTALQKRCSRRD